MLRISANIILCTSVLFFPWWVGAFFGILFLFIFNLFYEIIIWGIMADLLFGTKIASLYDFNMILSVGALLFFVCAEIFKKQIRFYS